MSAGNWVYLDVKQILQETDAAFLLRLQSGEQGWCPKSQMADPDDYNAGDKDLTVAVSDWIARQKGWM